MCLTPCSLLMNHMVSQFSSWSVCLTFCLLKGLVRTHLNSTLYVEHPVPEERPASCDNMALIQSLYFTSVFDSWYSLLFPEVFSLPKLIPLCEFPRWSPWNKPLTPQLDFLSSFQHNSSPVEQCRLPPWPSMNFSSKHPYILIVNHSLHPPSVD